MNLYIMRSPHNSLVFDPPKHIPIQHLCQSYSNWAYYFQWSLRRPRALQGEIATDPGNNVRLKHAAQRSPIPAPILSTQFSSAVCARQTVSPADWCAATDAAKNRDVAAVR